MRSINDEKQRVSPIASTHSAASRAFRISSISKGRRRRSNSSKFNSFRCLNSTTDMFSRLIYHSDYQIQI
ncbi:50S ribosomal protein [Dirofilaria immitis]